MRITITEPCVIETDGPVIISPLIEPVVLAPKVEDFVAGIEAKPVEKPKRVLNHYPARRKPMPRKRKVCVNCHRGYNGTTQQMYCSSKCKHEFYDRDNKPRPEGLDIHAGADGLTVDVVEKTTQR